MNHTEQLFMALAFMLPVGGLTAIALLVRAVTPKKPKSAPPVAESDGTAP